MDVHAQNKKQLQSSVDSLTKIASNPRSNIAYDIIDSLVKSYDIYSIIESIHQANEKYNTFSKRNVKNFYFDMLRISGGKSKILKERQIVLNEILSCCNDTSKSNYCCNTATSYALLYFNKDDFDEDSKIKLTKQLYGVHYSNVLKLVGMLDIKSEKERILALKNQEKDTDILLKINLVLARWGDKNALEYCLNTFKNNQERNDFFSNHNYATYIAEPEVVDFLIKEMDSSYTIPAPFEGGGDSPIWGYSINVLKKILIDFPKVNNIEVGNLVFYKKWLKSKKGIYKLNKNAIWENKIF